MATTDKYDRQLRLWGARGQEQLMSAKLLLLNAGPTGSEILKNVVLPGVGSFEIVDDHVVSESDLGNNFFVKTEDVNRPRAQVVTEWMLEMNPDVRGAYNITSPAELIDHDVAYVDKFSLIIATQVVEPTLGKLAKHCQSKAIPLLVLHSYGLLGYLRLQIPEHTIVDSKPDSPWHDLRLSAPFPELQAYADSFDLDNLDSYERGHVPYVVILIQAMQEWKAKHHGALPKTFAEKHDFKQLIRSQCHGSFGQEVNFVEAYDNAFKAYSLPKDGIPDEVLDVLHHAKSVNVTSTTSSFWFIARALAEFVDKHGALPLSGHVPDMTAFSHTYIALQKIYVNKAALDCDEIFATSAALLKVAGADSARITRDDVAEYCKHASSIRLVQTRSLADEAQQANLSEVDFDDENSTQSPLLWYFLIRAVQAFIEEFGKYPGADNNCPKEAQWLVDKARSMATHSLESFPAEWITLDHGIETCRNSEVEIHNIAAILGGVGAQEAVKVITHQFMPLNNTYIFNGITGCAATYAL
ncbi:hypothetical protein, variant [Aphanomyces invadans]|uniref:NEDD8-activating enzyme E1 regulatory subunit n=1 Tax=Aphanomyces invadans TaxID=157072 RepID=A0A024TMH0_9STRA|nr:hypothetical protein, variant [Aphanomyces invadans]ETV94811.1 hypothetical protein, variant [Aphanomyces invadans]|eukprot:XP_008876402.1 hypothetical protein, variant [Aphanomyces invadans]